MDACNYNQKFKIESQISLWILLYFINQVKFSNLKLDYISSYYLRLVKR